MPVFAGVGGGLTQGLRVLDLALHAEFQGAIGVVVNAPTKNETVRELIRRIDVPVVVTVVSEKEDIDARVDAGTKIVNVSAAVNTPQLVRYIRKEYPQLAIIATGGPTEDTIRETISAGANAITWTPPSSAQVFKGIMEATAKASLTRKQLLRYFSILLLQLYKQYIAARRITSSPPAATFLLLLNKYLLNPPAAADFAFSQFYCAGVTCLLNKPVLNPPWVASPSGSATLYFEEAAITSASARAFSGCAPVPQNISPL